MLRPRGFSVPRSAPRTVVALLVMLSGLLDVLLVLGIHFSTRIVSWERELPFALLHGTRTFVALAGIFLIVLGRGLLHGSRTAWIAAIGLLAGSSLSHLVRGIDIANTIVGLGLIAVLLWRRRDFRARPDALTTGRAIRIAMAALVLLPLYAALGFVLMRHGFTEPVTVGAAAREIFARMLFTISGDLAGATRHARWFLDSITFVWAGVLGFGVLEILRPVLRPTVETARDRRHALDLLHRYGRASMSYMTPWPGNTLLLNGQGDAYVAYRLIGPVALVFGDPVGLPSGCPRAIDEFVDLAAKNGWTPCFYGVTSCYLRDYERHGLASLPIGEDTLIDLPSLEFRGKQWQDVRTAINRARRAGISFRMISQVDADPAITRQLWEISDAWTKDRGLPEMDFTLGRLTDPPDPEVRTAIAIDQEGRVQGFITWLPVYASHGWVIDLMRRREDAFRGIMEFLIAESASVFKEEHDRFVSLGAAPLARTTGDGSGDGVLENVLDLLSGWLDTFYHFGSLYEFKRKFSPRWEPIFLVYPGTASLPRVGYALLRAYLPDLSREDVRLMITDAVDALPWPWQFTRRQGRECPASELLPGQVPQRSEPDIEPRQPSAPAVQRARGDDQ